MTTHLAYAIQSEPDYNLTSLDSIQLLIPYKVSTRSSNPSYNRITPIPVSVLDTRLIDNLVSFYETTGEYHSTKQHQPLTITDTGITHAYKLVHQVIGKQNIVFISVAVSAKLLSADYLQGITIQNIYQVYQAILQYNIIAITFNDFLNSYIHKADLKYDTQVSNIAKAFKTIQKNLRLGFKRYRTGITVGERKSLKQYHFTKFYDKTTELISHSNEFHEKHLRFQCPSNLLRTEITFTREQLQQSFPNFTGTLQSLLINTQLTGKQVMTKILHTEIFRPASPASVSSITPLEETDPTEAAVNQKLAEQIAVIIELCLGQSIQMTLSETQDRVIRILKPGINKRAKVRRFTEFLFTKALEQQLINQEIKKTLHL